jgi:hypothetical protein
MPEHRQPESWETDAAEPFVTIECAGGTVAVSALGGDRFTVEASGREPEQVAGYDAARGHAHALAGTLDAPAAGAV